MYKNGPDYDEEIYTKIPPPRICCEVYTNNSPTFKENWVASPPNRRSRAKYKMFPSVSVQVQHGEPGNMHPYNFEIQAHSLSISIAKTYLGK